jgi:hypothetical protein
LQVDVKNAFNCIDRGAVLESVHAACPKLDAWVAFCYGQASHLFAQDLLLESEQGVQQGDPLGPLLFSLAWQRVVLAVPSKDLLLNSWYLDDGHVMGDHNAVARALAVIRETGRSLGVELNVSKCRIWGPGCTSITDAALQAVPQVAWGPGNGLRILGLPVEHPGATSFSELSLQDILDQLQAACGLLGHLGNTHHQHLLLRYCLDACRVTHFLRGVPCTPTCLALLVQGRECVLQVLRDTLGNVQLDPFAATQACLPLRLGGCGIKDHCWCESRPA